MANGLGQFAETVGVNVPLVSFQHQYLVTEEIDGVNSDLPTLRDPDRLIYFKEEVGGLVMVDMSPILFLGLKNLCLKIFIFHYLTLIMITLS